MGFFKNKKQKIDVSHVFERTQKAFGAGKKETNMGIENRQENAIQKSCSFFQTRCLRWAKRD